MSHEPPRLPGPQEEQAGHRDTEGEAHGASSPPPDSARANASGSRARRGTRQSRPQIPSPLEIQGMLAQLFGMVATDLVSAQKAGVLRAILSDLQRGQSQAAASGANAIDLEQLRHQIGHSPMLLNLLAPVLPPELLQEFSVDDEPEDSP